MPTTLNDWKRSTPGTPLPWGQATHIALFDDEIPNHATVYRTDGKRFAGCCHLPIFKTDGKPYNPAVHTEIHPYFVERLASWRTEAPIIDNRRITVEPHAKRAA